MSVAVVVVVVVADAVAVKSIAGSEAVGCEVCV
jgi:hypothetical protein